MEFILHESDYAFANVENEKVFVSFLDEIDFDTDERLEATRQYIEENSLQLVERKLIQRDDLKVNEVVMWFA